VSERGEQPFDLTVRFLEAGAEIGIQLDGVGESVGGRAVLQELEAVAADLERLRGGAENPAPVALDGRRASVMGDGRAELAHLGQRLFSCLFDGADHALFVRADHDARREGRPLRLLIKLAHGSPLERIPWEVLHDGRRFLAKDPRCAVVRYFYDPQEVPAFSVPPPLRILVTSACPPPQPPLNLAAEVEAVLRPYRGAGKLVESKVHPDVSLERLEDLWRTAERKKEPFHVWHHCGHGHQTEGADEPRFLLSLERRGLAEYATVDQLSEIVGACPGLRLAVLNVCHGGSSLGLMPELARLNVPVVIGHATRVAHDAAYKFAAVLHQCLLDLPVEFAVSQARRALAVEPATELEWSGPLLCSRRKDWGPILRRPAAARPEGLVKRGFSARQIRVREERMRELLTDLDSAFRMGAGRHGS
jgi:CHAT domain